MGVAKQNWLANAVTVYQVAHHSPENPAGEGVEQRVGHEWDAAAGRFCECKDE
jgi:hypothetical protein